MIIESPVVENYRRNLTFTSIKWLEKSEYDDLKLTETIHPSFPMNEYSNEIVFIGKNKAHFSDDNKQLWIGYITSTSDQHLKIMRTDKFFIAEGPLLSSDYYILSLSKESFSWVTTNQENKDDMPNFAFRACLCMNKRQVDYYYIGRSLGADKYVGNISRSDGYLYVCDGLKEPLRFEEYEILCLKPSPTSLKQLCCILIRKVLYENDNKPFRLAGILPASLYNYVKFPSYLSVGECLLIGEKMMSPNGHNELELTSMSQLDYYSLDYDLANNFLPMKLKRILYDYADSIWVNKFHSVIHRCDNEFVHFLYLLNSYDIDNTANPEETLRVELTDDGELLLRQNGITLKKFLIFDNYN